MIKFWLQLSMCSLVVLAQSHAYNWQQHVPEEAKRYIPEANEKAPPSSHGVTSLKGKINLTSHAGPLDLTNAQVVTPLNVFGPLTAHHSDFLDLLTCHGPVKFIGQNNEVKGNMEVHGPVEAQGMTFVKDVTIYGPLNAKTCTFQTPIHIYTSHISLKDCQITDLTIHDSADNPVEIEFDNVKVSGSITVSSGQGTLKAKNSPLQESSLSGISHFNQ